MGTLLRRHALFRIDRGQPIPDIRPAGDVALRRITAKNVGDVRSFRPQEIADVFHRQLERGQLGIYAYRDGRVVAHGWMIINRGQKKLRANHYFVLRPHEALVHFCSVAEPHRGGGIYQALLCELYRHAFSAESVDTVYIDTEIINAPSRSAIGKTATFVANAYYLNVWGRGYRLPW